MCGSVAGGRMYVYAEVKGSLKCARFCNDNNNNSNTLLNDGRPDAVGCVRTCVCFSGKAISQKIEKLSLYAETKTFQEFAIR